MLVDDSQRVLGTASAPLTVSRPHPLWSEQDPEDWWRATLEAVRALRHRHGAAFAAVRGIGLSGQMHGAVLLDAEGRVLRPAILWNDGRSAAECAELEAAVPDLPRLAGNRAMAGFTAPKLLWVRRHEPEIFARTARVLLPKDYLRLRMTGEAVSDMSDAAGTLWLDVASRAWSPVLLAACGLDERAMPRLVEGSDAAAPLLPSVAADWGFAATVTVAGGAGDNAAGAVGVGVIRPGSAFLSLGTSGVLFVCTERFRPNPDRGVHAFCHCLPGLWHQMSVVLSAASCLAWVVGATGAADEAALLAEIAAAGDAPERGAPLFLPYLSGERTPHNDPHAKGVFFGLGHGTGRAALGRAVLEGVGFACRDGLDALTEAGTSIDRLSVIGGGARSPLWGRMLADILGLPLVYHHDGEVGPAFGAARLGRLAVTGEDPAALCTPPVVDHVIEPAADAAERYGRRLALYRQLYQDLRGAFRAATA